MSKLHNGPYPLPTEPGEAHRLTRLERERFIEFWDSGDEHDESLQAEWDAIDNPTRPPDRDLLSK